MARFGLLVVVLVVGLPSLYSPAQACGDKFLMVGRGAKFQRAYASVHPGKVLIYARPSTDAKAAIRDTQLHKALRQAGHAVSVIEDWALLEQALKTVPVDVVLVDVAEVARLRPMLSTSPTKPDALYVASPQAQPPSDVICRLKSSDRPLRFLDEVENTMKARARRGDRS
ncbi:MAG TPA: hypothetical protein VD833_03090 [Vicinamibacterales bacterium]|nr:hypothetical protein [Vicinamibacterales bacterium]